MQNSPIGALPGRLGGQPFPLPAELSEADKIRALENIVASLYLAIGELARIVEDLTIQASGR